MALGQSDQFKVAIIGMAGRFPGARSLQEYWKNLLDGVETVKQYSDHELLRMGVSPDDLSDVNFVRAGSSIAGRDLFAASFFGYSPREAELMDPQHRLFLECSWEAIENAGYAPRSVKAETGVFAGTSLSSYLLFNLINNPSIHDQEDAFQVMIGNDKDFLSTRVSYEFDLKGPSITIQSGCSTSLSAVHIAVQFLLACQCDLAIAGGVSVSVPQRTGYRYERNGIVSPDGHCRAFDAESAGTLFGEGVGVVVLKRLEDAVRDRDFIYSVILGTAANNDGSSKLGYTAPSIDGQAQVIERAQAIAGIDAETVSYVEAHGTATELGDPVEVAALTKAFRRTTGRRAFCGLGTVKSNFGHLDAAAGIAGLIKVALMLHNEQLAPSLHFQKPNPKIDFENSPFYVVTQKREWESDGPRRAGVSSFGIGGTNVHAVLEQAPTFARRPTRQPWQILTLSARSDSALERATCNLVDFLQTHPDESLADIAHTLQTGREQFEYRRSIVCRDLLDAQRAGAAHDPDRVFSGVLQGGLKVAFMFPGGATQYPGMGRELYDVEPEFRKQIDLCSSLLAPELGYDLRDVLYGPVEAAQHIAAEMIRPSIGLPSIFVTEYALARLLMSWGISPSYMLGHSLGEYAAACLAGVFSIQAALSLVVARGRLLETLSCGSMLSVCMSESEIRSLIDEEVSVAAVNAPDQCVLSGPADAIQRLSGILSDDNVEFQRLHINTAAHSSLVEPITGPFRQRLLQIELSTPSIPFISNLTGTWIKSEEACNPEYWVQHLRNTVRFADGLKELMTKEDTFAIEVGPSRTLTGLAVSQLKETNGRIQACLRHPQDPAPELQVFYTALARMWTVGAQIDWHRFSSNGERRRVPLPSYPFERERYWIDPKGTTNSNKGNATRLKETDALSRVYSRSWVEAPFQPFDSPANTEAVWLLLLDEFGIGDSLRELLVLSNSKIVTAKPTDHVNCSEAGNGACSSHTVPDFQGLLADAFHPRVTLNVIHCWSVTENGQGLHASGSKELRDRTLFSFIELCKSLEAIGKWHAIRFFVVSNNMLQVSGADLVAPEKSSFASACHVAAQEIDNFRSKVIDISLQGERTSCARKVAEQVLREIHSSDRDSVVAYRALRRWVPTYNIFSPSSESEGKAHIRGGGIYLITGGTGELGPLVADSFAARQPCKLVITGRSTFPPKEEWETWLRLHEADDRISRKIRKFSEVEAKGSEVTLLTADSSDESQMTFVFQEIRRRFGALHGVVHLAGLTGVEVVRLITDLTEEECERQLAPKARGCEVLRRLLEGEQADFCLLFSSTASIFGGTGLMAYAAANGFMDGFIESRNIALGQRWFSINWDGWLTESSAVLINSGASALAQFSLSSEEALQRMHEVLAHARPGQYVVSKGEIQPRIDDAAVKRPQQAQPGYSVVKSRQPTGLIGGYKAPTTELERKIASVWGECLGLDKIGLHDSLFELGGNSLIAIRIASKLTRTLATDIPVGKLFEYPTVFSLSNSLSSPQLMNECGKGKTRGKLRRETRAAMAQAKTQLNTSK
ncbi:MAG: acyltransferase domain-containing protein [Acidobacteriaceae bacterium]|nr:acyltransferase domain-containing protein [Acidobacteriaceae bacterium]